MMKVVDISIIKHIFDLDRLVFRPTSFFEIKFITINCLDDLTIILDITGSYKICSTNTGYLISKA